MENRPHWIVSENRLAYVSDGKVTFPSATQIWSAVFGTHDTSADFRLSPRGMEGIQFSRVAADPVIVLEGSLLSGLRTTLAYKANGTVLVPPSGELAEQLIIGGVWYPVPEAANIEVQRVFEENQLKLGGPVTLGDAIRLQQSGGAIVEIIDKTVRESWGSRKDLGAVEEVDGLRATLYSYQETGVAFLKAVSDQNIGCILADEMGLGKTLQVIALLQDQKNQSAQSSLIVVPATLLENWRREIVLFAPNLTVFTHSGPKRPGDHKKLEQFDVVITSYETAVRDEPLLSSAKWNLVVLDEAQNIKNPDAVRTMSTKRLPRRVSIAVTGTPVENRLTDLWSICDFVLPGLLGRAKDFESEYDDTHEDASRLAPVVAPIILRRRVAEVAKDLPPRVDIPQCISMTRELAELYERVRADTIAEYGAAGGLVSLQKLRMFCAHPRLLDFPSSDPAKAMPKYTRLLEILDEIFDVGEKCLIFTSYTKMTDILVDDLRKRFASAYVNWIDGRVPVPKRQLVVDQFSATGKCGALVLNPKAAGTGLNITAANHVIHYNPEWNPAVQDQASARSYRRKQTRPVTVHHLYFADTVEDVMIDRLDFKRGLSDGAVTGHKGEASTADIARALQISPISTIETLE